MAGGPYPTVTETLLVCERVADSAQPDVSKSNVSSCCDCSAPVWKPVNAPPYDACLCSFCQLGGRPQRAGRSAII